MGGALDGGAAGEAQIQEAGHLIEGLSCGIVQGVPQLAVAAVAFHKEEPGVPARDQEAEQGKRGLSGVQPVAVDMALQMVDRYQWQAPGVGQGFRVVHSHQQRARQAGPVGHRNGPDLPPASRALQRRGYHGREAEEVLA